MKAKLKGYGREFFFSSQEFFFFADGVVWVGRWAIWCVSGGGGGGRGQTARGRQRQRVCGFFVPPFHFNLSGAPAKFLRLPVCASSSPKQSNLCMHELPQVTDRILVHYDISSGLELVHI